MTCSPDQEFTVSSMSAVTSVGLQQTPSVLKLPFIIASWSTIRPVTTHSPFIWSGIKDTHLADGSESDDGGPK